MDDAKKITDRAAALHAVEETVSAARQHIATLTGLDTEEHEQLLISLQVLAECARQARAALAPAKLETRTPTLRLVR